tara:strand:+ start:1709 stop:3622 length:1914 start_codon:yes stop_codon:yes gene_type:complete
MKKYLKYIFENYKRAQMNKYIFIILIFSNLLFNNQLHTHLSKSEKDANSENLYRKAKSLEKKGLFDDSEDLIIQIFNQFPNNERYFNALKKILIKKEDCLALMNYTEKHLMARGGDINSQINKLESSIICNADWESLFNKLLLKHKDFDSLRKIISTLLRNNQSDLAIKTVYEIRENNNESSFFAYQLGWYYYNLQDYENSLIEYLNHIEKNPKQLNQVNQIIIKFPDEKSINEKLISILNNSNILESKIILSDIYFKMNMLEKSIKILKENSLYNELFSMALSLDSTKEYDMVQDLFLYIIDTSNNKKLIEESIYKFALSLEKRSILKKSSLPLSRFMNENDYFNSPFVRTDEKDSIYINKAQSMYNSLNVKNNRLNSLFRLSEIDFRIFKYLDASLENYKKINNSTNDKELKLKSINRIVDVLIAKGQLDVALEFINSEILSNIWDENQKITLEIKLNQILFYQSKLDLVFENLNLILNRYSVQESNYNDILSVLSVILILKEENQNIYNKYIKAQLKINQNKRTESIGLLNSILEDCETEKIECKNPLIINLIKYQISNLLIYQGKVDDAIAILNSIEGEDIYNQLSKLFLAEIYDYIKNDKDSAAKYYYFILKNYPQSIYYENIRKRLRTIMD